MSAYNKGQSQLTSSTGHAESAVDPKLPSWQPKAILLNDIEVNGFGAVDISLPKSTVSMLPKSTESMLPKGTMSMSFVMTAGQEVFSPFLLSMESVTIPRS